MKMTYEIIASTLAVIISIMTIAKPVITSNAETVRLRCAIEKLTESISSIEARILNLEREVMRHE